MFDIATLTIQAPPAAKRTTADGATDPLIASTAMAAAMTMAQSRMMASPANRWRIYKILSALMIAPIPKDPRL